MFNVQFLHAIIQVGVSLEHEEGDLTIWLSFDRCAGKTNNFSFLLLLSISTLLISPPTCCFSTTVRPTEDRLHPSPALSPDTTIVTININGFFTNNPAQKLHYLCWFFRRFFSWTILCEDTLKFLQHCVWWWCWICTAQQTSKDDSDDKCGTHFEISLHNLQILRRQSSQFDYVKQSNRNAFIVAHNSAAILNKNFRLP